MVYQLVISCVPPGKHCALPWVHHGETPLDKKHAGSSIVRDNLSLADALARDVGLIGLVTSYAFVSTFWDSGASAMRLAMMKVLSLRQTQAMRLMQGV